MFDTSLPGPADLVGVDDAAVVSAMSGWAVVAAAAEARRLAAVFELVRRRCYEQEQHPDWIADDWSACAAEVGAALNVGRGWAESQMRLAVALVERLPKVGARFLRGEVSVRVLELAVARTALVTDVEALAELDDLIAGEASGWTRLPKEKLVAAVDAVVACVDPVAVRRSRRRCRDRDFTIGDPNTDESGTTSVWGRLSTPHAALLREAIDALVASVCRQDPRSAAQLRADAIGALAAHATAMACLCGRSDCPAGGAADEVAARFVVHILADPDALEDRPDPGLHGPRRRDIEVFPVDDGTPEWAPPDPAAAAGVPDWDGSPVPEMVETLWTGGDQHEPDAADEHTAESGEGEAVEPAQPEAPAGKRRRAALIPNMPNGVIPPQVLAELINGGAKISWVRTPEAKPEPRYRPSAKLAEFVRLRDLTCRAPGCCRSAFTADIDHTNPWPAGPTHPSNAKAMCRIDHLIKTFWPGFEDRQMPDGTVVFTTPSGHTYTTTPGIGVLFPGFDATTAALPPPESDTERPEPGRTMKMPKRKRTRAQDRAQRIQYERAQNQAALDALGEPDY